MTKTNKDIIPDSFTAWLKQSLKKKFILPLGIIVSIIGFLASITTIASTLVPVVKKILRLPWPGSMPKFYFFQAIIAFIFFLLIQKPLINLKKHPRASQAALQFYRLMKYVWILWVILYVWLFAQSVWLDKVKNEGKAYLLMLKGFSWKWALTTVGCNLICNLQSIALFMCYWVLARETVHPQENREHLPIKRDHTNSSIHKPFKEKSWLPWTPALVILALLTLTEVVFQVGETYTWPTGFQGAGVVYKWLSGVIAGSSIALLTGRLDRTLISPPIFAIIILYFYGVIQPAWVKFFEDDITTLIFASAALLCKIVLFFLVLWLLNRGILVYCLDQVAKIHKMVKQDRHKFLSDLKTEQSS